MWSWVLLAACGGAGAEWDDAAEDDLVDAPGVFLEVVGDDGAARAVDLTHAVGTSLRAVVRSAAFEDVTGWTVDSLNADICQAVTEGYEDGGILVTLYFRASGATDLYVVDAAGAVVDWQPIEVRSPTDALLVPWDALSVGSEESLDALHVIAGTEATVAVSWATAEGGVMSGSGLLRASAEADGVSAVAVDTLADEGFEAFELGVDEAAPVGEGTLSLSAERVVVRDVPIVVHDPADIDAVALEGRMMPADASRGAVRAIVRAGDSEFVGVEVRWIDDGVDVGEGTWVEIEGDASGSFSELRACFGEICDTLVVPGHIVATHTAQPEEGPSCGCATGAAGAGPFGLLIAGLAGWRRRRR